MSQDRRGAPRQPAPNRPMAVRRVDTPKKKSGCGGFGAAMFVFIILGVVLLMLTGVIPSPFDPQVTPPPQIDSSSTPIFFINPPIVNSPEPSSTHPFTPDIVVATEELTELPPTATEPLIATATARSMPYVLRGTPEGYPNALLHPQYDCEEFLFIGGEVWDLREAPVLGLTVRLTGTYGGELVDFTSESGDVELYGRSGFEFVMENKQIVENDLSIQLLDGNGQALSAPVKLSITGECDANLLIVNYKQVQDIP